ncbi:Aliphatic sulfonates import ATP-binding protein SsuB [Pigmentiphaga humi]|uniref:Aliphatic sulfonates import ATP-binding protein SsuB n=1 Tax=Pigmentiphaga humi TaxID=2478468 RepID=A0A3P4AWS2_9BURK|nr:ABC transporter ATP-binding protein [Pigmentiphaga humi]VCU68487.1 Aliphatic sulfonates import ATP-binding protein SsuB [Pigmentiphaga humi]
MDIGIKLDIRGLSKSFRLDKGRQVTALQHIDLSIADGEFVCVIGASGCGKTTLLRIIGGFEQADAGHVDIDATGGDLITSTVFQEDSIFPWLTAEENVEYGLRIRGVAPAERRATVDYFIEKVGLGAFRRAYPTQLSGGMRQRVSVARAFANRPEVLLMDEPFGALDEQTRLVLQDEILRLWSVHRRTVIFVTHSLDEAIALSDRVVVLSARPGRIREIVPIDIPRPRNVAQLRSHPRYGALYEKLWNLIQGDVVAAAGAAT